MTPAIAAAAPPEVEWKNARHAHSCDECTAEIVPGDRMAIYDDVYLGPDGSEHLSVTRIYCEDCGHLLEDSLTITEVTDD
jgi:hypothetical protein